MFAHPLDDMNAFAIAQAGVEHHHAIEDLVSANIFTGDMPWKNVGVTRHDHDEIETLTDCNVRRVPQPRNADEQMSDDWQQHQERILARCVHDMFPSDPARRFGAPRHADAPATPLAPR